MAKSTAGVTWAQRKDTLFVTINVADVDKSTAKIELEGSKLVFTGTSNGKEYTADLELFGEVDPTDAASKYDIKPRCIQFHLVKKDKEAEFWPRLLKDKSKEKGQVQIDWSRYADEDEAADKGAFDTSQFGPGAMNFGGGGGGEDDFGLGGMGMGGGGGFPGMGGPGGPGGGMGGMDIQALLKQMQAGGGMGGMGGMPGGGGMGGDFGGDEHDEDGGADSDDDLPDLEEDEAPPALETAPVEEEKPKESE